MLSVMPRMGADAVRLEHRAEVRSAPAHVTLHSMSDTALAGRFRCWRGASGRRYTVSVFPFEAAAADRGLPDFDGCVVVPVRCDGGSHRALDPVQVEGPRDARALRAAGLDAGVGEWHVHLLAPSAALRRAAAADLGRRPG